MTRQAKYINPDGTPDRKLLDEIVETVVATAKPVRVILFGSAARSEMTENSDIDLMVVTSPGTDNTATECEIHTRLPRNAMPVDVIALTTREVELNRNATQSKAGRAIREGKVLYEETSA